jgi:hypothetical protein
MADQVADETTAKKSKWRENLRIVFVVVAYMVPLFWLWQRTGFPDALDVHITAHGKAGLFENWWYSYLLIERHRIWDLVTFAYMWAAVVAVVIWLERSFLADRRAKRLAMSQAPHELS